MDENRYKKYEPVDGKWYITRELGRGAFGVVFEVERRDFTDSKSALKIITIPSSPSEISSYREENYGLDESKVSAYFYSVVEEFMSEIQLMAVLKGSNNIVTIEDYDIKEHEGEIGWDVLIRMELLTPMNQYFAGKVISREDVIRLGIDICKALEDCRAHNIIHRDIKPSNIFVSGKGEFKLGDFGVARTLEKTSCGLSKKGTYIYMAPEVFKGGKYNANIDIYSLGIVLYKLLNNNMEPFCTEKTATASAKALEKRFNGTPMMPPANADKALARVVLKACAFNPENRYANATDMRLDLERLLDLGQNPGDWSDYEPENIADVDKTGENVLFCPGCGAVVEIGKSRCSVCGMVYGDIHGHAKKDKRFIAAVVASVLVLFISIGVFAGVMLIGKVGIFDNGDDSEVVTTHGEDTSEGQDISEGEDTSEEGDSPSSEDDFQIGAIKGSVYDNKYFGIRCDLPGWVYADSRELLEIRETSEQFVSENATDKEAAEYFKTLDNFTDMTASAPDGFPNVNVIVSKTDEGLSNYTEKEIVDNLLDSIVEYYKSIGVKVYSCEGEEMYVGGVKKYCIKTAYNMYDIDVFNIQFITLRNKYNATTTIVGTSFEQCAQVCDSFELY